MNIAIDGPSGSGKSTLAKGLAAALGYIYIDTGALYRAIGLFAARHGVSAERPEDVVPLLGQMDLQMRLENGGNAVYLDGVRLGEEIRTSTASHYASQVSKVPQVRAFLLETQQSIARQNNVIMDGRDIGTVILPHAQVKLYMEASPEQRAKRRLAELLAKGEDITEEQVLADIKKRDANDSGREIAPAKPAEDAIFLDNSSLTPEQTVEAALRIVEEKLGTVTA
ncbi:MAG: (d)CMP kinase [Clostridia bacterium]|nr:(d)CMP kinase [Clostridia bacterium]